jgi:hypothetical protein
MTAGVDIVNIAQKQTGFYGGTTDANPYGVWYGIPDEPWCAMFVSWCFAQANASHLVAAQTPKGFAYCPAGLTWFQKNGQIIDKYSALPGDLVFYSWAGNGVADHVEIVVAASKDGITTIGGNTGPEHMTNASQYDGHGVYLRHRAYLYVLGIARPAYTASSKPATSASSSKKVAAGVAATTTAIGGGAAAVHNGTTTTTTTKTTTAVVAPPFPGTSTFKVGAKGAAELVVAKALAKAGLLPEALVSQVLSEEEIALIPIYQKNFSSLKSSVGKGIDLATYTSMVKESTE